MFQMLSENNFVYDCSWPTRQYGYIDAEYGLYPYTLDYKSKQVSILVVVLKCFVDVSNHLFKGLSDPALSHLFLAWHLGTAND